MSITTLHQPIPSPLPLKPSMCAFTPKSAGGTAPYAWSCSVVSSQVSELGFVQLYMQNNNKVVYSLQCVSCTVVSSAFSLWQQHKNNLLGPHGTMYMYLYTNTSLSFLRKIIQLQLIFIEYYLLYQLLILRSFFVFYLLFIVVLTFFLLALLVLLLPGCSEPLGMKSGHIQDYQVTASSIFRTVNMDMFTWEPGKARLDKQGKVNAWTAGHSDQSQWLQV